MRRRQPEPGSEKCQEVPQGLKPVKKSALMSELKPACGRQAPPIKIDFSNLLGICVRGKRKKEHEMRKKFMRIAGVAATAAAMLLTTGTSSAQRVGADTIALFPKNVGEFAYANLKQARSQKWFPQLQEHLLPERFRQFEKFLASAGVDATSQVEELAWGLIAEGVTDKTSGTGSTAVPTGEEIVGGALGSYNPESTEAYFKAQEL